MSVRSLDLSELQRASRDPDLSGLQDQSRTKKGESVEEFGHGEVGWELSECEVINR